MIDFLAQVDTKLLLLLNSLHHPFWDTFMWMFTGKTIWIPMYAVLLFLLFRNLPTRNAVLVLVAIVLTITFADQMCSHVIRPLGIRLRPSAEGSPVADLLHLVNNRRGSGYGFPSCHAANSFALAMFFFLLTRHRALACFLFLWATLNSYTRIYLGLHYPGDLLVGAVVGMVGAYLCYRLYAYTARCAGLHTPPHPAARSPYSAWPMAILAGLLVVVYIVGHATVVVVAP